MQGGLVVSLSGVLATLRSNEQKGCLVVLIVYFGGVSRGRG
jgi:hypothetical protein